MLALAFNVGCGFAGGGLREVCPKEAIWHFSPFVFTGLHRYAWRFLRRFQVDWQVILIAAPGPAGAAAAVPRARVSGSRLLFHLGTGTPGMTVLVVLATVMSVAIPIKIWNSARIEHKLQEQEQLLMAARLEALASQINPHFLFNTLNSIASLIRSQPDTARTLIVKLSALLRRLLRSQDHFVTLREELSAIDEYLDIECVRFGLRLGSSRTSTRPAWTPWSRASSSSPSSRTPSSTGSAPKLGDGAITIRSRRGRNVTSIEVIDNGLGMGGTGGDRTDGDEQAGIGLKT